MLDEDEKETLQKELTGKGIRCSIEEWMNYEHSLRQENTLLVEVESRKQVIQIVKTIKNLNEERKKQDLPKVTIRIAAGWHDDTPTTLRAGKHNCCFFKHKFEEHYNESFSWTPGAIGDVIIRFGPIYQESWDDSYFEENPLPQRNRTKVIKVLQKAEKSGQAIVRVNAGVQIGKLADALAKETLSLSTVSMITHVSAVGLAANAGHGTGKDQSSFAGLIVGMEICDADGNIRYIKENDHEQKIQIYDEAGNPISKDLEKHKFKDFEAVRAAHLGLFGVVLSIDLRCENAFKLEETIHSYKTAKAIDVDNHLNASYFTLMHIPTYSETQHNTWQIRTWEKTTKRDRIGNTAYAGGLETFIQQLKIDLGEPFLDVLVEKEFKHLIPAYMHLASNDVIGKVPNPYTRVGEERDITHYQVAFPRELSDLSFMFPVKNSSKEIIANLLQFVEELLKTYGDKKIYPVTHAIYMRYFKGTRGGLSTSHCEDNEHIVAFEVVTHPKAPGVHSFKMDLINYFREQEIPIKFHWGKEIPVNTQPPSPLHVEASGSSSNAKGKKEDSDKDVEVEVQKDPDEEGVSPVPSSFDINAIKAFVRVLYDWHSGAELDDLTDEICKDFLINNPFITDYFAYVLNFDVKYSPERTKYSIQRTESYQNKMTDVRDKLKPFKEKEEITHEDFFRLVRGNNSRGKCLVM